MLAHQPGSITASYFDTAVVRHVPEEALPLNSKAQVSSVLFERGDSSGKLLVSSRPLSGVIKKVGTIQAHKSGVKRGFASLVRWDLSY